MNGQPSTQALAIGSPFGIIAGGGAMPFAVADSLAARGIKPIIFGLKGFCDPAQAARFEHYWTPIGKLGALLRLMRSTHCRDLVFIGTLVRPAISEVRLDWGTLRVMPQVFRAFRGGDDHLLTSVSRLFENEGFRLLGVKDVAPDLLMPAGSITRATPDADASADIARGRDVLSALSPFDIGQACVVIDGHVVGIEDIGGTDALLARVAELRANGRIRAKVGRGVLVKAPKSSQDLRFDLPTTGPRTVDGAIAAKLGGIAIVAGNTIVAEPQAMIAAADAAGLFVTGLSA
ncbi:LpxI family protein [Tardiphaga alba]|uniref:LpxI family protein n=1 Tax=Tardiphaga alba TaxID=340268 RepID=A0ABX8AEH0_9BRAD|nr:UDP-2,3-diacylglucosamine diphosphatase LpxI [Tardiphaga alba]QUS40190.1 LpxI family protein [Tardiphaga alba]